MTNVLRLLVVLLATLCVACTAGPTPHPQKDAGLDADGMEGYEAAVPSNCSEGHDVVDWDDNNHDGLALGAESDAACAPGEPDVGPLDTVPEGMLQD